MTKLKITAELISQEEGGYAVYCPELDIYTQGEDEKDAINNMKEAAELHVEEIGIKNLRIPEVKERKIELMVGA